MRKPNAQAATSTARNPNATGRRNCPLKSSRCAMAAAYAASPNHAPWPKDTRPVCPTRMLSAMHAMAKISTSLADVMASPRPPNAKGSRTRAAAAIARSRWRGTALLEAGDALAQQPARGHQQHEQHEEVDGGLGVLRITRRRDGALG